MHKTLIRGLISERTMKINLLNIISNTPRSMLHSPFARSLDIMTDRTRNTFPTKIHYSSLPVLSYSNVHIQDAYQFGQCIFRVKTVPVRHLLGQQIYGTEIIWFFLNFQLLLFGIWGYPLGIWIMTLAQLWWIQILNFTHVNRHSSGEQLLSIIVLE